MFFAPPYASAPCGMYTVGHLALFLIAASAIALGLYASRALDACGVRRIIRVSTAVLWVLELAKILFVLLVVGSTNPNDFIPLYYCSLILYAGLFASLGHGVLQKLGDVFIATGGIVGGACFLVCPNTSLPRYPFFHFISFHSFLLHGLMVFLGLLLLWRGGYRIKRQDAVYCVTLISAMCLIAFIFNTVWDLTHPDFAVANLMFMSKDFPGTPVSLLYRLCGRLFPIAMWLIQALGPFFGMLGLQRLAAALWQKRRA